MARVYLETSFVSACVTTREDAASRYRRQASNEWWASESSKHDLLISAEVLKELADPRHLGSAASVRMVSELPLLAIDESVVGFAEALVQHKVMPTPVAGDAIHVAACCVWQVDYLLSWNVRHLANTNKVAHLRAVCLRAGLVPPTIVTPDLLWGDKP